MTILDVFKYNVHGDDCDIVHNGIFYSAHDDIHIMLFVMMPTTMLMLIMMSMMMVMTMTMFMLMMVNDDVYLNVHALFWLRSSPWPVVFYSYKSDTNQIQHFGSSCNNNITYYPMKTAVRISERLSMMMQTQAKKTKQNPFALKKVLIL